MISNNQNSGAKVQDWINDPRLCAPVRTSNQAGCPSSEEIVGSIRTLYYYAKNIVYAQPNNYDELRRIQGRLEFTRSLSLIAFIYFVISVLLGTFLLLWQAFKVKRTRKGRSRLLELRTRVPVVVALLFCVYFLSLWAFARETDAFNKRVFGYFSTLLISEDRELRLKRKELEVATQTSHPARACETPKMNSNRDSNRRIDKEKP